MIQELKIAVVPTPNATQPMAPACGVCESEPDDELPGLGVFLEDLGVADGLGALAMPHLLAVEPDPLLLGELPLLHLELVRDVEQALFDALLASWPWPGT